MKLTARQQRALEAICDTFAPAHDGWPSAAEIGVADAIAAALPDPAITGRPEQLLQLLNHWDSRLHSLFTIRRTGAFSALPAEARVRVLLSWADSALAQQRGAFQALRKAIGYLYVMLPGANGGPNPAWAKFQYPGPLGTQRPAAARPLRVAVPDRDMELMADVCVVGSGAGGGTAAAVLAAAGKDVIVLEAGGYYDDADFDGAELKGFYNLYADRGFASTADRSVGLLAGECVGGGTVVNYCTSFRTPDEVRSEWAAAGVPWFTSEEYTRSLDAVCERLHVNLEHNRVSAREEVLQRGLRALGWHVDAMPRNVTGCDREKFAATAGLVARLARNNRRPRLGCWTRRTPAREYLRIRGPHACASMPARPPAWKRNESRTPRYGALQSGGGGMRRDTHPALLLRSGLSNAHIGRHLRLHPVSNVCGVFDEEIRPWEGTMQAIYSDEHRRMTGNYGVKYETTALQPVIAAAVLPWREPGQYRSLLAKLAHTSGIGVLLRDRDSGRVNVDRTGWPVTHYRLSAFDRAHLRAGFHGAARILEAAGARLIYSPHAKFCSYEPGRRGSLDSFARDMDAAGWRSGQLALFSFHIMGSARMGSSARNSATNPDGETWEARNLYVVDGASFPSASGVNPMISIEAIAHRNAAALAMRL